jgi:hypothetical protein
MEVMEQEKETVTISREVTVMGERIVVKSSVRSERQKVALYSWRDSTLVWTACSSTAPHLCGM